MSEIEQATANPGERRALIRRALTTPFMTVTCTSCPDFVVTVAEKYVGQAVDLLRQHRVDVHGDAFGCVIHG